MSRCRTTTAAPSRERQGDAVLLGAWPGLPSSAVAGLPAGAAFALVGVCLVLPYRMAGVVSFTLGAVGVFGATLVAVWTSDGTMPIGLAVVIGFLVSTAGGALIGVGFARWFGDKTVLIRSAVTIALQVSLSIAALKIFGNSSHNFPELPSQGEVNLSTVYLPSNTILAIALMSNVTTRQAEREFTQVTGDKIYKSIFDNITGAPDLTSIVSQLANSGCKAFFFIGEPSTVESILQVANQQHLLGKVVFSTLSFAYTAGLASYLKDPVYNGLSVSTDYLPFTLPASRYPGLKEFKATMTSHQVTIDGTSEGGYVEAKLMIDALKSIKGGSYTRSTVAAALRSLHNVSTDGLAPPFTWGRPVRATYFVVLKNGAWQCVNSCKPASL